MRIQHSCDPDGSLLNACRTKHLHGPTRTALCAALLLALCATGANADDWVNPGTGDWFLGSNWADGTVPTAADDATVDNGGTATVLIASAAAGHVLVGNTSLNLSHLNIINGGQLSDFIGMIAQNEGSIGDVIVSGQNSRWENSATLTVASSGTGSLAILDGGTVLSTGGIIGRKGNGTVLVGGLGSSWINGGDLNIGSFDTAQGRLDILSGGKVSNESASVGINTFLVGINTFPAIVTIDGPTSVWSSNGELTIGESGVGVLNLVNSGTAIVGGGSGTLSLGKHFGNGITRGELNIGSGGDPGVLRAALVVGGHGIPVINFNHSSPNYTFTNTGDQSGLPIIIDGTASVNHVGTGTTRLLCACTYSGATKVDAGKLLILGSIDSTSQFIVGEIGTAAAEISSGGIVKTIGGVLGMSPGSSGRMEISGIGSIWEANGKLIVGEAGAGSILLRDGGSSIVGASPSVSYLAVGNNAGSFGSVTVDGVGSRVKALQGMLIGADGIGQLDISRGGSVVSSAVTLAGLSPSGQGFLTIDGENSNLTSIGLSLGNNGHAELTITAGGQAVIDGDSFVGGMSDGDSGDGLVVVDGWNSKWLTTNGLLYIGQTGHGIVNVQNGASVEAHGVSMGARLRGRGELNVNGTGSTFSADGLKVGDIGDAALSITNGGKVLSNFINIGGSFGIDGLVSIVGVGSRLETRNSQFPLSVGIRGVATLSVQDGGAVSVGAGAGAITLARFAESTGTINIGDGGDAGFLEVTRVDGEGNAFLTFNHDQPDYYFTQNGTSLASTVRIGGNVALSQVGSGVTSLLGFNDYTGATTVNAGTLRVNGSITSTSSVNNGGTLGGSGTVAEVNVADGGILAPGSLVGTLTTGKLLLAGGSRLNFQLASPSAGANDKLVVNGDLVLDGVLNVEALQGFAAGTYRLISFTGGLTDNTLTLGSLPAGFQGRVDTSSPGQVNLVVIAGDQTTNHPPTGVVTITGTPREGMSVSAASTLADTDGLGTFAYQWFLDDTAVAGATAATLALDDLAVGKMLRVVVSYTDGQGFAEQVSSAAVGPVAPAGTDLPFQKRLFFVNPADNVNQQTFIRLVNPNDADVAVQILGFDDSGAPAPGGEVVLMLMAQQALQLNAADLELGNTGKGMDGALGDGVGKWQLKVHSTAPIEAMSLIRTPDGFLTSVSETVPTEAPGTHVLYFANPGSNPNQRSFIRVVNRSAATGEVVVSAVDDAGMPAPGGDVRFSLAANAALNFNAEDYSNGNPDKGIQGAFGTGTGKWRLTVTSALNLEVMSLIRTPDGFVTDLSNIAPRVAADDDSDRLLLAVNPGNRIAQQGLIRLVNSSGLAEHVVLSAVDDSGTRAPGEVAVDVAPFGALQLLSSDLEQGNPDKGLTGAFGSGQGRWQINMTPSVRVEAQSLLRVPGGFLTNLSASAPHESRFAARLWIFNPGSNDQQRSILRLINRSDAAGAALIEAIDDAGQPAPGGSIFVDLAPRAAVELDASELETGSAASGLIGALGDGTGKWRLHISADVDIEVQGLLETPTGFLTNLSGTVH